MLTYLSYKKFTFIVEIMLVDLPLATGVTFLIDDHAGNVYGAVKFVNNLYMLN